METDFNKWAKKLALGSAQFGLDYGISNLKGKIKPEEVVGILKEASVAGIDILDTAIAYGDSEVSIGNAMDRSHTQFDIISKIPSGTQPEQLLSLVKSSLKRLGKKRIKGFLTHNFKLYQQKEIRKLLQKIRNDGLVNQIGVSVYHPREVRWLLDNKIDFDIVQLPFNIFDRRFEPLFPLLKEKNTEIHVRSVFLQGLLFMDSKNLSQHFNPVKDKLATLRQLSKKNDIPLQAIMLNFALMQKEIDKVIIGVTSVYQLKSNLEAFSYRNKYIFIEKLINKFKVTDEQILLPFNWK